MPDAPRHPCSQPGCHVLVRGQSRCDKHMAQQKKEADGRRLSAAERGYDGHWKKIRDAKLAHDPLCERCRTKGFVVRAALVHHRDRNARNNPHDGSNHESLCWACHEEEHKGDIFGRGTY